MLYFFAPLDDKANLLEILRKYSKILKIFFKKLLKMHYFSIVSKKLTKDVLPCCAFGRKSQFNENFEKTFEVFEKFSSTNC